MKESADPTDDATAARRNPFMPYANPHKVMEVLFNGKGGKHIRTTWTNSTSHGEDKVRSRTDYGSQNKPAVLHLTDVMSKIVEPLEYDSWGDHDESCPNRDIHCYEYPDETFSC